MNASDVRLLKGARVYLSGPMDFVASRADEKQHGWRNRVGEFVQALGVTVFDPWFKPEVRGLHEYGREGETTSDDRAKWSFENNDKGAMARAACAQKFWQTLHVDLRMVDTSDFIIAYCPTNIYSVGTPHEIVVARQQRKPVLLVSPPVEFPALARLRKHLHDGSDAPGIQLLEELEASVPIKDNPSAIPSLWYMALVPSDQFFDGFGFSQFRKTFDWPEISLDRHESCHPPQRPLLPFLKQADKEIPRRWDPDREAYAPDEDWLLWDLARSEADAGATPGAGRAR